MPLMTPAVKETLDRVTRQTDRAVYTHMLEDLVRDLAYPDEGQDIEVLRLRAALVLDLAGDQVSVVNR